MNKNSDKLPVSTIIYIVLIMWWVVFTLLFYPLITITDICKVIDTGFCMKNAAISIITCLGLFVGLSLLIPPFRKMYNKTPWLFPFVKMFINCLIIGMASSIINYGYEVQSQSRHIIFIILMIVQVLICRFAMGYYYLKKPIKNLGE